jgi:hypothetical protein
MNSTTEYNINRKSSSKKINYEMIVYIKKQLAWPNRLLMDREYRNACMYYQKWRDY